MAKKMGLFGGTFDPPHTEHRNLLESAIKDFSLDGVVVMPSGNPPHKKNLLVTDAEHRYRMAELAFGGIAGVRLSRYEMERGGESYTVATLRHLTETCPDTEWYFIVGEDSFRDMRYWREPEEIRRLAHLIVVKRRGVRANLAGQRVASYEGGAASSTQLRVMLEFRLPAEGMIKSVAAYVRKEDLYRSYCRYTDAVRCRVTEKRYAHTARVAAAALALNADNRLNLAASDVFVAATLHDIAKYLTFEQAAQMGIDTSEAERLPPPVQHSYLGAEVVKKLFPELGPDVVNAVRYHTTFRRGMSALEKVVGLADSIEAGRRYPGVNGLRRLASNNLNAACLRFLQDTVSYLKRADREIAADTLDAIAYFKELNV